MKNKSVCSVIPVFAHKNSLCVQIVAHELYSLLPLPGRITVCILHKLGSFSERKLRHLSRSSSTFALMFIQNTELSF